MGAPGWPELGCCTASMDKVRMVLMQSWSNVCWGTAVCWLTETPSVEKWDAHGRGTMAGDTARQEAGALYCKNRRNGVPLNSEYLGGMHRPATVSQHGNCDEPGGKKLRFGRKSGSGGGDFAERDEIGFNRDAFGNFHVKQSLKGLESAGVGYGETQEEFLNGFFAACVFYGALGGKRGGASDDHDRTRRVEARNEGHQSVVFGEEGIGRLG